MSSLNHLITAANESTTNEAQISQDTEPTSKSHPTLSSFNYSKIEMLLGSSKSVEQRSGFKKKNSFVNRKTIRNYTTAAQVALAAAAASVNSPSAQVDTPLNLSSSLLLLQPAVPQDSVKQQSYQHQLQQTFDQSESEISCKNLISNSLYNHHHNIHHNAYSNYFNQPMISSHDTYYDETANLRLLVEVAVGLWEEQQRNYEFRN